LSILQVATKNDNADEESLVAKPFTTITDWNVDTTTVDLNVPNTLSLGRQSSNRLDANRILSRPNGVANTGTLLTTIQSSLTTCLVMVQVTEILPPILLPRWDMNHGIETGDSKG
jgi:hypothetical protein